ncbi:MAG TPA: endolytic transglycosylase MltG [Anaerolineales bacterium]|nr:endolytic transglycosylase MltG [Anaerolineales bacterium]
MKAKAIDAVAFPAETPYFFFRAKCDGSGYHSFAETFEEHVANGCE